MQQLVISAVFTASVRLLSSLLQTMFIIIGLGNPGAEYKNTRHNVGFLVVDELAKHFDIEFRQKKSLEAEIAEGEINQERVVLVKPQTFMNASGRAVQKILKKYSAKPEDLLIVYDDADLKFGDVKMKPGGSSAGHRGMQSIIDALPAGAKIARVRVGIGRPEHSDIPLEDYVLQKWTPNEQEKLPEIVSKAVIAITS